MKLSECRKKYCINNEYPEVIPNSVSMVKAGTHNLLTEDRSRSGSGGSGPVIRGY